jgi:gephyrin
VDPAQVARRARESPYPLIDVATAQKTVLEHAEVLGTEMVTNTEALGRVLAEDVFAKDPLPPFPASIKDGYAVLASDGAGKRQVLGTSVAGVKVNEVKVASVMGEWRCSSMHSLPNVTVE